MTKPALRFTGIRDVEVRTVEKELNEIWKEIDDEINIRIKALVDNKLEIRTYVSTTPISMPTDYSKVLKVYDEEGNYIGQIPIFS